MIETCIRFLFILCYLLGVSSPSRSYKPLAVILDSNTTMFNLSSAKCFFFNIRDWEYVDMNKISNRYEDIIFKPANSTTKIIFNFCSYIKDNCDGQKAFAAVKYEDGTCKRLTNDGLKNWTISKESNSTTLTFTMSTGEKCNLKNSDNELFLMKYIIKCNESSEGDTFNINSDKDYSAFEKETESCVKTLYFTSKAGCPSEKIYLMWKFLLDYNYFFGCIFILLGMYLCILGHIHNRSSSLIFGPMSIISVSQLLFMAGGVGSEVFSEVILWIYMISALVLGVVIGIMMVFHKPIKKIVIGATQGGILAVITFFFLAPILPAFPFLIFLLILLFFSAFNAFIYYRMKGTNCSLILASSICGAYLIIRGVAIYIGGLPYETLLMDLIHQKEYDTLYHLLSHYTVASYFIAWIIIFLVAMLVQWKRKTLHEKANTPDGSDEIITAQRKKSNPLLYDTNVKAS